MPNEDAPFCIGVTGGVGSGKSEVLRYLEEAYHAVVLRTDDLAKELMLPGGRCFAAVHTLFGDEVLTPDGCFDRAAIAARVFADPALLEQLNAITHPAVWTLVGERLDEAKDAGAALVCLESALFLDARGSRAGAALYRELWYVYAAEEVRRARLKKSRGYSDEKITAIMANQVSAEVFRAGCDCVIDNSGDFSDTARQVDAQLAGRLSAAKRADGQDARTPEGM